MGDEDSKRYNMENCLSGIAELMCENRLKLNNEKTEFTVFASERQRHKVTSMEIGTDGIKVGAADDINYVGMWLDNSMTMRKQVEALCRKVPEIEQLSERIENISLWSHVKNELHGHGIRLWQCTLLWAAKQRSHKASETSKLCHKNNLDSNKYDSSTLARHQLHWFTCGGKDKI